MASRHHVAWHDIDHASTHILCPTDYSEPAATALECAVAVAGWHKARVTLLHVCSGPPAESDRVRLLREAATARDMARSPAPLEVSLAEGDPARAILIEAARLPADLLVLGTHGTSGFTRLIRYRESAPSGTGAGADGSAVRRLAGQPRVPACGETLTASDFTLGGAGAARLDDRVELPASGIDLEQLERSLVVQALERAGWNQTRASALLGLNRDQIRYRIEKFHLEKTASN